MKSSVITILLLVLSQLSISQGIPSREETNLNSVYDLYGLSGENVLIVMIDRGIDYSHPDFIDENGETRLAYIYDMIDPSGANDPNNPYGVGTIFTASEINTALENNDPMLSTDRYGHGTATTSIACGNGSGTEGYEFQGVAPHAKIISIKITHDPFPPYGEEPGQEGFFNSSYIPIALNFASDKIEEIGLPSVTLMNIGSIGGPTDGTSLICEKIDEFVQAGHTFVCGVGDDGGADNYASGNIAQDETIEIEINKAEAGNLRFDLWYSEDDRFTVSIERPNGVIEGPFDPPNGTTGVEDQLLGDIYIGHRGADVDFFGASSYRRELLIDFTGNTGIYKVILTGTQINEGIFSATLNPATYYNNNKFLSHVTFGYSINDYASAGLLITPGDYVVQNDWIDVNGIFRDITGQGEDGEIWIGSSSGPTQNGSLGIDFVAPGEVCHAAYGLGSYYSSFQFNVLQNSGGWYGIQNAVSAAAPLSTGIIALMLQANPELTPLEIKTILQASCTQDEDTGNVPNLSWGYGKIDALLAIETTVGIKENNYVPASVFPNPTTNGKLTVELEKYFPEAYLLVYNIFGQTLINQKLNNIKSLDFYLNGPSGFYFVEIITPNGKTQTLSVVKQ